MPVESHRKLHSSIPNGLNSLLGKDAKAAFGELCQSLGCEPEFLGLMLQLLATNQTELPEIAEATENEVCGIGVKPPIFYQHPTRKRKLNIHALDSIRTASGGRTIHDLEVSAKRVDALITEIIELERELTELKSTPLVYYLNERRAFPKGDLLRGLPVSLREEIVGLEDLRTLRNQAERLRPRLRGLVELPRLAKKHVGMQKYPDRKELLVSLMRYVYERTQNQRTLARLLTPILTDVLPAGSTVLNKAGAPVSKDGIRQWFRRHVKPLAIRVVPRKRDA